MDADSIDLAHSDVLTLLDSHLEDVVETEDYLQWSNWHVLSQASNALADPALETTIIEGLMAILPLAVSSWISWAQTGFPQLAAMLQEHNAQRELAILAAPSAAPSPAPSHTSSHTCCPSAYAKAASSTRVTFQASFVMASVSSGQVGELASSTSSSVFIGAPPAQRKDSSKAKASPTSEALANMAKAMDIKMGRREQQLSAGVRSKPQRYIQIMYSTTYLESEVSHRDGGYSGLQGTIYAGENKRSTTEQ
ncbi:hypothetical protein AcV7_007791 [Taiwanofungus camphoratus]|nr:hypothetical protein AcV7_007791 [Antrodia cinnamomea]